MRLYFRYANRFLALDTDTKIYTEENLSASLKYLSVSEPVIRHITSTAVHEGFRQVSGAQWIEITA